MAADTYPKFMEAPPALPPGGLSNKADTISCQLACVTVVSVSFKPSGASARGHWAKKEQKSRSGRGGGGGGEARPSRVLRACPAWLEGNGNDCYAGLPDVNGSKYSLEDS